MTENNLLNNQNEELTMIMRYLTSVRFTIPTKSIKDLEEKLILWMTIGLPGAMVIGRPRIGKTRSIYYIADNLQDRFGYNVPVIIWNMTEHPSTEKNFYSSLLMAMSMEGATRNTTALVLKQRTINHLSIIASECRLRKVVMFIDEANKMSEKDFDWLGDLYNTLNKNDIQLTTFLVGTDKLSALKDSLIRKREGSTLGRFMATEAHFKGICDENELGICLLSLNNKIRSDLFQGSNFYIMEKFFPAAYRDQLTLLDLKTPMWNAFQEVRASECIQFHDIPMKYFFDTLTYCLQIYGRGGPKEKYFPDKTDIIECIDLSGYKISEDKCIT